MTQDFNQNHLEIRISELENQVEKFKKTIQTKENMIQNLLSNLPGMIYRAYSDWSTEIITNTIPISGYSIEEFNTGKVNWLELIHPDDKKRVCKDGDKLSRQKLSIKQEYRIITKEGKTRWVRDHKTSNFDKDRKFDSIDGIVFDITEEFDANISLEKSEQRYRLLLQSANDAIYVHAISPEGPGAFLEVNEKACDMLGYTRNELLKMKISDIAVPEQKGRIPNIIKKLYDSRHAIFITEDLTKDGKRIPVEVSATMFDFDGTPAVLAIVRNITERKKSQEDHDRLISAIEQVADMVVITDIDGVIKYVNPVFEKITGYSDKEAVGQNPRLLKSGKQDDGFYKNLWGTILSGKQWTGRIENKRKDGSFYKGECSISPVKNQNGDIVNFVWISRDITKQLAHEQRSQQNQKLESIGALAGGIAHDFNNILSSIIGYTELALDEVGRNTIIEDNLQEVYAAGKRAKDLVGQILAFARQSDEELKPIQVTSIVKEVLKFIRSSIPATIEIHQNIESESLIMGNATRIHQVIMNLCTNAAHAMDENGGILEIGLKDVSIDLVENSRMSDLRPGDYIELKISDTGSGIDPEIIGSIFEPYFTTKGPGEGTGMGLAMVHGIVEKYGGKITVDSRLGEGSTFRTYLPIARKRQEHRSYLKEELPSGTEKILFIDDEAPIAKMGSQILERLGYQVTTRTGSLEALELVKMKSSDFDLVITDMTMPNMTGDRLAVELMKIRPDIPVILCTGYTKKISEKTALEIGIKAFLHKPIVKVDLARTVREVLDDARG